MEIHENFFDFDYLSSAMDILGFCPSGVTTSGEITINQNEFIRTSKSIDSDYIIQGIRAYTQANVTVVNNLFSIYKFGQTLPEF